MLLEAYQRLEAKYTDVHLTIVGDGEYLKECKDTAEGLKIKNISFPGRIVEGISNYFLGADIFVLPGLGGLAVSDALAHGVPVIASIADGCEKDLLGTGAGIIEEELSPEVLYHHLLNLYANPEVLKDMKVEALNVINSKYNISNYVQSIKNSIDFVLREDEKATKKN